MPRGVPNAGFRKTKNFAAKNEAVAVKIPAAPVKVETVEEIDARISERFEVTGDLVDMAITGAARALIISGPGGLGKSHTVEEKLAAWDPKGIRHTIVRGKILAPDLYIMLHKHSDKNQVLVFDDADNIFWDDISLNMLKAVCDTTKKRVVSYMTQGKLYDDDSATALPKQFEFHGSIIFITNQDFDEMIQRGSRLAPHLQAMMTRAQYIDLSIKTKQDYIVRIRQVLKMGLLSQQGLDELGASDVMAFIESNQDTLRDLSLRVAIKLAAIRKTHPAKWEKIARITVCK
jgi:hypothetical protein